MKSNYEVIREELKDMEQGEMMYKPENGWLIEREKFSYSVYEIDGDEVILLESGLGVETVIQTIRMIENGEI